MCGIYYILVLLILAIQSPYYQRPTEAQVTSTFEVGALRSIKSNLVDPMNALVSWNSEDPCASMWVGIYCTKMQDDGYQHIQEIRLLNLNLSGTLSTQLGLLTHLEIIDFMWNNISGSIPQEIGNITSLKLLLLNGNQLSGSIPDGLGNLPNLNRLQIDQNHISGFIPKSFSNLYSVKHLHMNNNSISGPLPPELSRLSRLRHLLLDNNNLSGSLPPQFSNLRGLKILQLDNNHFSGSIIPASYGNMTALIKLSLRNCSLEGRVPNLSQITHLGYIDLSANKLKGPISPQNFFINITTIDLSSNLLTGKIPSSFTSLPKLQILSLRNNFLSGSIPAISNNLTLSLNQTLIIDLQNNSFTDLFDSPSPLENVAFLLFGNPLCNKTKNPLVIKFCHHKINIPASLIAKRRRIPCSSCPTDRTYEHNPISSMPCLCSIPIGVRLRLKSPAISDFLPYIDYFKTEMTSQLDLYLDQLFIVSYIWESGPRLNMYLKLFPSNRSLFNMSEILRLEQKLSGWDITLPNTFGPYELLNFSCAAYAIEIPRFTVSRIPETIIMIMTMGFVTAIFVLVVFVKEDIKENANYSRPSTKISSPNLPVNTCGVKEFRSEEMRRATIGFCEELKVGHGRYWIVYKGILADSTLVAIKFSSARYTLWTKDFQKEISLLSGIHHKNLVSLVGYCNSDHRPMLVYEFMKNGTLCDHLARKEEAFNVTKRLRIALETARGILYLHTEFNPPILHRDIKSSKILLDSNFVAKVSGFRISRHELMEYTKGGGYIDPEYLRTRTYTQKSDVYSLGVVFLELLSGVHPFSSGRNILREANNAYKLGNWTSMIDRSMGAYPSNNIKKFFYLALKCCKKITSDRPSMLEVVRDLEIILSAMPKVDIISTSADS